MMHNHRVFIYGGYNMLLLYAVFFIVKDDARETMENQDEDGAMEEQDIDEARDYWFSEHHRFEYSQYSEVLLEIDPLSYHNVGLAVPGTFIERRMKL